MIPSKVSVTVPSLGLRVDGRDRKMKLNPTQVKSLKGGVHADGGGLYLIVRDSGERVWAFRFTDLDGKRAQMEFAKAVEKATTRPGEMTLAEARQRARLSARPEARRRRSARPKARDHLRRQDLQAICRREVPRLVRRQER